LKWIDGIDGTGFEPEQFTVAQNIFPAADHGERNSELRGNQDAENH